MPPPPSANVDTRRGQIFPTLTAQEIQRLHRFGSARSYAAGTVLLTAGRPEPGLQVLLPGAARMQPRDEHLRAREIVKHRGALSSASSRVSPVRPLSPM